jgi:chromosome segregation protein
VFLRRLAIRGFKSFADRTVFDFTPGVAVIVGPNGSGKSNLVDAIAWVLGEQGAKTLRGGKMEDVIFAGTPKRPGMGRAEVELTIDNSSGILPIEFTEVTVSRSLMRTGESEYAINGVPCRLLDVQELLSDSGIGRELHTIVGQGQLDDILQGSPADRRAVVEEASGLLKHRKRKERAVRKLERVDADVDRLGDVIAELRRQIRPLERQAEVAKRAEEIEAELREIKLKLWLLDYRGVTSEEDADAERRALEEMETQARALAELSRRVEELEAQLGLAARGAETMLATEYRLSGVADRLSSLARFADERRKHLEDLVAREPISDAPGESEIAAAAAALEEARTARAEADADARTAESDRLAVQTARDEATRAREEVVHLHGERAALRAAVEGAEDEQRSLAERREAARVSAERCRGELDEVRADLERLDREETELGERSDEAEARRDAQRARHDELAARERETVRHVEALQTRAMVLREELERDSDPLRALEGAPGIGGRLYDALAPREGFERAVRAALGPLTDAIVAATRADAMSAIDRLKRSGARGTIVVAGAQAAPVPMGVRAVSDVVDPAGPDAEIARAVLSGIALADTLAEAAELTRAHPELVVVTLDGDLVSPRAIAGGSPAGDRDPRDDLRCVEQELTEVQGARESLGREVAHARAELDVLEAEVAALGERLNELDAQVAGATERLAQLEREAHATSREDSVLAGRLSEVAARLLEDGEKLHAVETRLGAAVATEPAIDAATLARIDRLAAERSLRLGEATERERAAAATLASLQERRRRASEDRERWETGRARWRDEAARAAAVSEGANKAAQRAGVWVEQARGARSGGEETRAALEAELAEVRRLRRVAETAVDDARDRAHEADLRRAERSHRIASLVQRLRDDYQMGPEEAAEAVRADPAEEDELRKRAVGLERRLGLLGRVNPIAMEQYQSLVDRHAFLQGQVDDLRKSRRDLMAVVTEVDTKIVEIFGAAFADIQREFDGVFERLFPGGEGRIVLTEPDDLLNSGIDVEARPAGKRVKRVSLLSGGERSLVAVALLFSVFRARPSPFYLLDEVEPALDDVNLHRFLSIAAEFRERSQLLIVTHQKRTMEIADSLYGISMAGEGVSKVICERLERPAQTQTIDA